MGNWLVHLVVLSMTCAVSYSVHCKLFVLVGSTGLSALSDGCWTVVLNNVPVVVNNMSMPGSVDGGCLLIVTDTTTSWDGVIMYVGYLYVAQLCWYGWSV